MQRDRDFLLVPAAIDRAAARKIADQAKRGGRSSGGSFDAAGVLEEFAEKKKSYVMAQYLASRRQFERLNSPGLNEATINEAALNEFEACWKDPDSKLEVIPGKEAIGAVNQQLQKEYGVSLTFTAIVDAMAPDEVPAAMKKLIHDLSGFSMSKIN